MIIVDKAYNMYNRTNLAGNLIGKLGKIAIYQQISARTAVTTIMH